LYRGDDTARPRIVLIGAGALGCAAARALAQSGAVDLTMVDDDVVEPSNLQRQVLYDGGDVGRLKVDAAAARLKANLGLTITTEAARIDAANAARVLAGADVVIDGCDDPDTKFLLNRVCVALGIPLVYGGVARTGGQWMLVRPGISCCLECVFPDTGDEIAQGCSALGILAPVAGFVGVMQAQSALAVALEPQRATAGRLFVYELTGARLRHVDFPARQGCTCRVAARTVADSPRRFAS